MNAKRRERLSAIRGRLLKLNYELGLILHDARSISDDIMDVSVDEWLDIERAATPQSAAAKIDHSLFLITQINIDIHDARHKVNSAALALGEAREKIILKIV